MIKFIDLFCGIGGFRLAFESLGAKCVFGSDIDPAACQTYQENFGDNPLNDIRELKPENIPSYDILCAGFPCQPFSIAGHRKGFDDARGTVFFDILRILEATKPKAFLLENVRGLMSHDKGKTFEKVLSFLSKYNLSYQLLNSKDYGVPQSRERIYIVGLLDSKKQFQFPKKVDLNVDISNILQSSVKNHDISNVAKFNIENHLQKRLVNKKINNNSRIIAYEIRKSRCSFKFDNISPCLTAKMGTGGNNVPILVKELRKLTVRECLRLQGFPENFRLKKNNMNSYRLIGNSVSVPLVRLIGKNIIKSIN